MSSLKQIVDSFKSDKRFKIIQDENPRGFWDGIEYWEFTELESKNLNLNYVREIMAGSMNSEELSILHKKKNCVYSNSSYVEHIYRGKKILPLLLDKLKEHIDKKT